MSTEKSVRKEERKEWEKVKVPKIFYLLDGVFWVVVTIVIIFIVTTILSMFGLLPNQ